MQPSCIIAPNMINAPWLDKPNKITESELDDLETNYQTMLNTIRNDTFGGIMPPKEKPHLMMNPVTLNSFQQQQFTPEHSNVSNHNTSIDIFTDSNINPCNNLLSALEFEPDSRITTDIFMSDRVNESVQRVRTQLNLTNSSSPSVSPIQQSTVNNSLINITLNEIFRSVNQQEPNDEESKHNLSLPFQSPSNDDFSLFRSALISPPVFTNSVHRSRRSQSEQPAASNINLNSSTFSSAPPPRDAISPSPPQLSLEQLNEAQSRLLSHYSVTNSMQFTPQNLIATLMQQPPTNNSNNNSHNFSFQMSNSASFDINNLINANDIPVPAAPQRHNYRSRYRRNRRAEYGPPIVNRSMVHVIQDNNTSSNDVSHEILNIHNRMRSMRDSAIADLDSSSFVQSIDDGSTPTNIQIRSHSVSLDAPRPQRLQQRRRYDESSVDLTGSNNINL